MSAEGPRTLWRSKYRLQPRGAVAGAYDFLDAENGQPVASAHAPVIAPAAVPRKGWSFWSMLGFAPLPDPAQRPRLLVEASEGGLALFTLRVASGLMYDSRRVYDGSGQLLAHFRSPFKTTLRGGFTIIDLRGLPDDGRDISQCPMLGRVSRSGETYRFSTIAHTEAGHIMLLPEQQGLEIAPASALQNDTMGQILLLAASLSLAWQPPAG